MRKKIKCFLKSFLIAFLFIFALLAVGYLLTDVLRQKWSFKSDNAAQQIVRGYYEEPEGSLDVLMLGASTIRNGISPLQMFQEYGFTGYSRATSIQMPEVSYHLLVETLETQDIQAVVMDATTLTNVLNDIQSLSLKGKLHEALDYMPLTEHKYELIKEISKNRGCSALEFLLPLYTYHDRCTDLEEQDFTYREWGSSYPYKGQFPTLRTTTYSYPDEYMQEGKESIDEGFAIDEMAQVYFQKMIDLCKEKNIAFILVKTPVARWDWNKHNILEEYANAQGVEFLDFCLPEMLKEIEFDGKSDFCDDGRHLNVTGAQKISSYLGAYLNQICTFTDKRKDEGYADWQAACKKYKYILTDVEMMRENNFVDFLEYLNNSRYIVMIATQNDTGKYFTEDVAKAFEKLGVNTEPISQSFHSYLAVINAGELVYEDFSSSEEIRYSSVVSGHYIEMSSFANPVTGSKTEIFFDGESCSPEKAGFNIVVYDKNLDIIVTRKAFNTGHNGKEYHVSQYSQNNYLASIHDDPVRYFEKINKKEYIVIMCVCDEASKYLPDNINKQLQALGLKGLQTRYQKSYIAVLNDQKLYYEKTGKRLSRMSKKFSIDGVDFAVTSSSLSENPNCSITFSSWKYSGTASGLHVTVYDKNKKKVIDKVYFSWKNQYNTEADFEKIQDLDTYLKTAEKMKYNTICLYLAKENEISTDNLSVLNNHGFTGFSGKDNYLGIKERKEVVYEENKEESIYYQYQVRKKNLKLRVRQAKVTVVLNGIEYSRSDKGIVTFVYDPVNGSIVSERAWE